MGSVVVHKDGFDITLPPAIDPTEQKRRRRNVQSHQAILQATLDLVNEIGYGRLTIEGIAAKAGVGKTTIYRWWRSKGELVIEALADVLTAKPIASSGDTRQDLLGIVEQAITLYGKETGSRTIIAGLIGDMHHNPELAAILREQFVQPRRNNNRELITRAIEHGDLPADTDIELLIDCLVAPIAYRALVTDQPVTPDLAAAIVDQILEPGPRSPK
jgi:AcrR family transcriptional regulator